MSLKKICSKEFSKGIMFEKQLNIFDQLKRDYEGNNIDEIFLKT
jgi:hypothetical protein